MKVAFLTRYDRRRASSRVRAYQYQPYLAQMGITARYLPWANRSRLTWPAYLGRALLLARWADVVLLQKPFQPRWFVDLLARVNPRLVVDVDDAIWEPTGPRDGERARELGRRLLYATRRAGVAIAGSEYLAGWLRRQVPQARVHVLPSPVELGAFPRHEHRDRRPVVVGWIGSPENVADLEPCASALAKLIAEGLIVLRLVTDRSATSEGLNCEVVSWSLEDEPRQVAAFDVGIMPLRDTPRTRGRCGFKAIEYMAAGVPVVASPVPGPSDVVEDGVTGFLAKCAADWESALCRLAADPTLRARIGTAGRALVAERYSAAVTTPRLAAALKESRDLAGRGGSKWLR